MIEEHFGIFRLFISLAVSAIGVVSWWGIRRLVQGQDEINETLRGISQQIAETIGRVGQLEMWVRQRERLDDQRHTDNMQQFRDLWAEIRRGHGRHE